MTTQTPVLSELQQKDNLCGAFHAARVLRDFGFDGADEDTVAVRAGSVLPADPEGSVPPGETSRTDYRYDLPTVPPVESGTAAEPLAAAIESLSGGALRAVPLRGSWTAELVERLVDDADARLLANVRTGQLWGTHPSVETVIEELATGDAEGPLSAWDVGHFVELVTLVRGAGGSLVLVHDSYPSFGWNARHLQPPRAVAAALLRDDGREGGVLAVVPAKDASRIEDLAAELGLDVATWDNGTRR
jgi:hypothetical protein